MSAFYRHYRAFFSCFIMALNGCSDATTASMTDGMYQLQAVLLVPLSFLLSAMLASCSWRLPDIIAS